MNTETVKVWDPLVRLLHWSLVGLMMLAYVSGESESFLHQWAGYAILGIVGIRIVWGFIGSKHARFSDFVRSPLAAVAYLKGLLTGDAPRSLGHNPAGGWMALLLMFSLLMCGYTGWKTDMYEQAEFNGPVSELASKDVAPSSTRLSFYEEDEDDDDHDEEHEGAEDPREEFWEEVHEFFANFTVLLIFFHVVGVITSSLVHGENLVRAMLTGRKQKNLG